MAVTLSSIVPWGRSFDEYVRMFALSPSDLGRSIVDCAGGPSSFCAELKARGGSGVAVDPIYQFSVAEIRARVEAVRDSMIQQVRKQMGHFCWKYIRSPKHLEEIRMGAMERFLADFSGDGGRERYRAGSLPQLEFADGEFEMALCSHFLFLYSERLDTAFHSAAMRELLRVAAEVRIFPVTDLAGRPSEHLKAVMEEFDGELVDVSYEFLRGANQMLVARW